jgi:HK97 family phage portal protein
MGLWDWVTGRDVTPNATVETPDSVGPQSNPGDPDGVIFEGEDTFSGERAAVWPSPWDGWPAEWNVPNWDNGQLESLVDVAWACVDLNASVLSTMPVYRLRGGEIIDPLSWMLNPDPAIYASWVEFANELLWDYQMGEAFVLAGDRYANGFPSRFRVIPPWMVHPEMEANGTRSYRIGTIDVTGDMLHIRRKSSTGDARGHGPLEVGRTRMVAAGLLNRYVTELARGGGIPYYVIETPHRLSKPDAQTLLDQWWESRTKRLGQPAIITGGATARQVQMSPADIGLTDLAQHMEARIATLLGVPPFLMGLPSGGDSMTYSNVTSLFDYHDRSSLRPKATAVMSALSNWVLPRGQAVELNRDEYSRPAFNERAEAWVKLVDADIVDREEVRAMERFRTAPTLTMAADDTDPLLAVMQLTGDET